MPEKQFHKIPKNMKILVLGGGGFIGSTIVDRMLLDGHEIRIFERPRVQPYRHFLPAEKVTWIEGDFGSAYEVGEAIESMDAVVHLISTTLPKSSNDNPIYDVQSNVVSTLQMLEAMVARNVRKLVFISSGGTVYGKPLYLPVDEKHPTEPLVSYGVTKLMIEKYLHIYERLHGIRCLSLRVSNPYGERQRVETAQGAIGVFLHRAIRNLPLDIWGDGSVTRDYIHVSDVAEAFTRALDYAGEQRVLNISSGVGVSLNELIKLTEQCLNVKLDVRYAAPRAFDVPVSVLSNEMACRELGWAPRVTMTDGMARSAAWMSQMADEAGR